MLVALEGITATAKGVEAFLAAEGWETLVGDLRDVFASGGGGEGSGGRGVEIVRVLLGVVESDVVGLMRGEWMDGLGLGLGSSAAYGEGQDMKELRVAVWQLDVELLVRAPMGMRRRYGGEARRILEAARRLLAEEGGREGDLRVGLEEVVQGLEALGFR